MFSFFGELRLDSFATDPLALAPTVREVFWTEKRETGRRFLRIDDQWHAIVLYSDGSYAICWIGACPSVVDAMCRYEAKDTRSLAAGGAAPRHRPPNGTFIKPGPAPRADGGHLDSAYRRYGSAGNTRSPGDGGACPGAGVARAS